MLSELFGRSKDVDIDQLIYDIAEHKRPADLTKFEKLIASRRFFCRVDPASITGLPTGVPISAPADTVKASLAQINGMSFLALFTSAADKRLHGGHIEIEGLEALRMVLKCHGIDGLLFQNKDNSWVVLRNDQIRSVLARYRTS